MTTRLTQETLDQLFTEARTFSAWQDKAVTPELIQELYELTKFAPTSVNGSPARFIFVTSPEAKAKLKPALAEGNIDKTMNAPSQSLLPPTTASTSIYHSYFLKPTQSLGFWVMRR